MKKYALLVDGVVCLVKEISDEDFPQYTREYGLIIDVTDLLVTPSVGWVLSGNKLVPGIGQTVTVTQMIKAKISNYRELAPVLLQEMYAKNTLMGITAAQSDALFDEYSDVILRLQQGAFPTAIFRLQQKEPSGFVTQEMLDEWIATVQNYL